MKEKSAPSTHVSGPFYRLLDASSTAAGQAREPASTERAQPLASTGSPWGTGSQHGGPPAALLGRAVERAVAGTPYAVGRITLELLGPVPTTELEVRAEVLRPGRLVQLIGAELYDVARGRVAAQARAWVFPSATTGAIDAGASAAGSPLPHGPEDGVRHERPRGWAPGYVDAVDFRWVKGAADQVGPATVWMRTPTLVEGEAMSPLQRLLACADSASGVSAELDARHWGFQNTELTVHVLRAPVGEWLCLDAHTTLGEGSVAMAQSEIHDQRGLVARSSQALLIQPR
ncbi:thioesterase family protein [Nocardioides pacificus]